MYLGRADGLVQAQFLVRKAWTHHTVYIGPKDARIAWTMEMHGDSVRLPFLIRYRIKAVYM